MKFLVTLLIALLTFATADAAKVDIYKTAIQNKTFTLKYTLNEFPIRSISKDSIFKNNAQDKFANIKEKLEEKRKIISQQIYRTYRSTEGLIVFNGNDSYFESYHDIPVVNIGSEIFGGKTKFKPGGGSVLYKDGEEFLFQFEIKEDGTKKYFTQNMWGGKSSKIKTNSEKFKDYQEKYSNPYQQLFRDYNFGNTDLYQALAPILPPSQVIATPNTPIYNLVDSGNLDGGLTYEDFYGEKNNFHSAIRYYFSGDKMVKIATFNYVKDENRVKFYEKYVIDIEEFLTTADENYLRLPANLQDTTKRDKDGGKK